MIYAGPSQKGEYVPESGIRSNRRQNTAQSPTGQIPTVSACAKHASLRELIPAEVYHQIKGGRPIHHSFTLNDTDNLVPAGNVTIPPSHAVPAPDEVVEVRFLDPFRESGSIYQPVYVGKRCDIPATECGTDQLKYKSEVEAA